MEIELYKKEDGWVIRNDLMRPNCAITEITEEQLLSLFLQLGDHFNDDYYLTERNEIDL